MQVFKVIVFAVNMLVSSFTGLFPFSIVKLFISNLRIICRDTRAEPISVIIVGLVHLSLMMISCQ